MSELHSPPQIIAMILATMILIAALYSWFKNRHRQSIWSRSASLLLRMAFLAVLLWMASDPRKEESESKEHSEHLMILIDQSKSMSLNEPDSAFNDIIKKLKKASSVNAENLEIYGFAADLIYKGDSLTKPLIRDTRHENNSMPIHALNGLLKQSPGKNTKRCLLITDGQAHDSKELKENLNLFKKKNFEVSVFKAGKTKLPANSSITRVLAPLKVHAGSEIEIRITLNMRGSEKIKRDLILKDHRGNELRKLHVDLTPGQQKIDMRFEPDAFTTDFRLELAALPDELELSDNAYPFSVEQKENKLRVLYLEGTPGTRNIYGSTQYLHHIQFLPVAWDWYGDIEVDLMTNDVQRNAGGKLYGIKKFHSDGRIELDYKAKFPEDYNALSKYDLVILSDINKTLLTIKQLNAIIKLVMKAGGGFIMIGGNTAFDTGGWDKTVLEKIIPIDMRRYGDGILEAPIVPVFTKKAISHPILRFTSNKKVNQEILDSHPDYRGFHRIKKAKSGAVVLQRVRQTGMPIIAVQEYGRGRTMAFLSDVAGMWGDYYQEWGTMSTKIPLPTGWKKISSNNEFYARFWGNAVKWLCEKSLRLEQKENLLAYCDRQNVYSGEKVWVTLESLQDQKKWDAAETYSVKAHFVNSGQKSQFLEYNPAERQFITSMNVPGDLQAGEAMIEVIAENLQTAKTTTLQKRIRIHHDRRELEFNKYGDDWIQVLTSATGGTLIENEEGLHNYFQNRKKIKEHFATLQPTWNSWKIMVLLIGLLCCDWLVRRKLLG